jgi:hypothetical protein
MPAAGQARPARGSGAGRPATPLRAAMSEPSCPPPTKAYNLEILHEEARPGPECQGWCFGLPPGISPGQWPLDPSTGYPAGARLHPAAAAGLSLPWA